MKNLLKKLHIMPEDAEGSVSSRASKSSGRSSPEGSRSGSHHGHDLKPFSNLSAWLNSASHRHSSSPSLSSNLEREVVVEPSSYTSSGGLGVAMETVSSNFEGSSPGNAVMDEESQIKLALEMSAREDPEAVQIEAVKQLSLGCPAAENTPAEFLALRYLNYNALGYGDKILDGFYDIYDNGRHSTSESAPSLRDLQVTPVSEDIYWEAILVNREIDAGLAKLEYDALLIVDMSKSKSQGLPSGDVVGKLALLVVDTMGGQVGDPDNMIRAWISLSYTLKTTLGSLVLPLGSLTIGLSRHRALLFKVLADNVGIPCRLVKGQQNAGFDDVVMNFVKIDDGREYIVDLMAGPGVLIPSDAVGSHTEYEESPSNTEYKDLDKSAGPSLECGDCNSDSGTTDYSRFKASNGRHHFGNPSATTADPACPDEKLLSGDMKKSGYRRELVAYGFPSRPTYPHMHGRSPSWTEGVSSPAGRKMRVNDVSQYMIDAAKENPQLAQKLHDVLLESGVVAPPDLFSEVYSEKSDGPRVDMEVPIVNKIKNRKMKGLKDMSCQSTDESHSFLPPLPHHETRSEFKPPIRPELFNPFQNLGVNLAVDTKEVVGQVTYMHPEGVPAKYGKNIPVAAAAAAAAAVVASSMVAAAARSGAEANVELPVAAAATATAAAVVATTAAVNKQYEQLETCGQIAYNQVDRVLNDGDAYGTGSESQEAGDQNHDALGLCSEGDRRSNGSVGNDSAKSNIALGDVADCEIPWEEITLGERVGLGSYGEVYRGDWNGTEVAVKRFLDQDISGELLEEFRTEVRIMKRLRHPNVVLFMGAVTRAPNFSIVTEFLHRGSLYRLIHRPNNQLDQRRCLRMALDAARGMNYLHNCTPMIVHRDLKSPNLLVDRNWVVKVCDFGLSRMKHSTFLSSKSTAGTAEWMAPEVLRNEPSNEKCDVYSFGVILWELSTLQQPWCGMNPMQVVGAVGFQHRRLDIPDGMDPTVADIIQKCWQTDPQMRPSFSEIMAALKPLQKPISSSQVPKPSGCIMQNRRAPSRGAENSSKDGC